MHPDNRTSGDLTAGIRFLRPPGHPPARQLNTTIGVIATDIPLTNVPCAKMADVGHDGLGRAVRPAHQSSTATRSLACLPGGTAGHDANKNGAEAASQKAPVSLLFHQPLAAVNDCFARALVRTVRSATFSTTPAVHQPAYLDVFESADRR